MTDIMNVVLGLLLIQTKLSDPAIVTRTMLIHVPEAISSLFSPAEQVTMDSYGWEFHLAEGGYMYRLNK